MQLTDISLQQPAYVDRVDWDALSLSEAQRLREFGLCEGASIEVLHRGGFLRRGALACRIGRMTIAMRASHARAIFVGTGVEAADEPMDDTAG